MIHVNPSYLSTMEYQEVKMRCIDLHQTLTTTSRAPPPAQDVEALQRCEFQIEGKWN